MAQGNVKLGVSGIGEYKSAMQQARTATKTLDSELKLAQAQFRATGDAENYLQQRTAILNQQMQQQKTIVDQARAALKQMDRDGVDPASASYQQMKRSMTDAETEMIRLRQEAQKTGDELSETSESGGKMRQAFEALKGITPFASITAGFAAVRKIASDAVEQVKELQQRLHESAQWADELNTTAAQYGLSPEELQRWEYAAKYIDTDVDAILKARDKLMKKAGTDDYEFLSDGVNQWAVALRDAEGNARDSMDVFWDFIGVLKQVSNATERDRIAQEYFGKSFRDVQTLIDAGREGWEKYAARASVVTDNALEGLQKVQDAQDQLEHSRAAAEKEFDARGALTESAVTGMKALTYDSQRTGMITPVQGWALRAGLDIYNFFESAGRFIKLGFGGLGTEDERNPGGIGREAALANRAAEAGEAAAEAFVTGAEIGAEAAYSAGLAAGQAAAAGFAAGAGAAGSVTNNSTQNFGDTYNYYGSSGEDAAAAARRQAAGYGG